MRLLTIIGFLVAAGLQARSQSILIASASDMKFALDSLASAFNKINPGKVEVTYGSSGKLFEQISNGAPFDIFFSADVSYPRQLTAAKLTASEAYVYGIGRIVLWSKVVDPRTYGMNILLSSSIKKLAIANPIHAPYGKRAEQALMHYNLMAEVKNRLVYGENIAQTAQFVTTGAADAGIIALSLALSPNMLREKGNYFLIPAESHAPLEQALVITSHGARNALAVAFVGFVKSEQAQAILRYFGFSNTKK